MTHDFPSKYFVFDRTGLIFFSISKLPPLFHPAATHQVIVDTVIFYNDTLIVLKSVVGVDIVLASLGLVF